MKKCNNKSYSNNSNVSLQLIVSYEPKSPERNGGCQIVTYLSVYLQAKLSMMLMDEDDNRQHFSMKGIMAGEAATTSKAKRKKLQKMKKKQGASQVEDTFKVRYSQVISYNLSKSRFFLSIFSSADFCQAEELISDFFFMNFHQNSLKLQLLHFSMDSFETRYTYFLGQSPNFVLFRILKFGFSVLFLMNFHQIFIEIAKWVLLLQFPRLPLKLGTLILWVSLRIFFSDF